MLNASCFVTPCRKACRQQVRDRLKSWWHSATSHFGELAHACQSSSQTQKSNITHKNTTISIRSCRIPWQLRTFRLKDLDVVDVKECFTFQRLFSARIGDIEGTAVCGRFCDVSWNAIVRKIDSCFALLASKPGVSSPVTTDGNIEDNLLRSGNVRTGLCIKWHECHSPCIFPWSMETMKT